MSALSIFSPYATVGGLTQLQTGTSGGSVMTNATVPQIDGSAGMPQAPQMIPGGNLVTGVNTRYQSIFREVQAGYASANAALIAQDSIIAGKRAKMEDNERARDGFKSEVAIWQGRHKGCGPFSHYGCGDCDNNEKRNQTQADQMDATLVAQQKEVDGLQSSITQYLRPQLEAASKKVTDAYVNYNTDVTNALQAERTMAETAAKAAADAQNTINMNNPAYWAKQSADAKEKADIDAVLAKNKLDADLAKAKLESDNKLKESEQTSKNRLQTILIVMVSVVVIAAIGVFGYKYIKS